jgi:hypothetical protein
VGDGCVLGTRRDELEIEHGQSQDGPALTRHAKRSML